MTQLLRQVSVGTKFAAQFGGVLTLSAVSATALALTGQVRMEVAHPQLVAACVAATGLAAGAWTWLVGRTAARPLKDVVALAQTLSEAAGPAPFAVDRGDEASRLMRHLTHVQAQHQQLAQSFDQLRVKQEDQQDELSQWAADTLRLRAALDATETDALITDEDGVILFVTRSLAVRLKQHQSKIKSVLPKVDLDRLVGQRLEVFSQAADGADLTILPTSDMDTELCFAGLTFALRAQAVRGRQGSVEGHVVIWRDLTQAQSTVEQELARNEPSSAALKAELTQVMQVLDLSVLPTYVVDLHGHICLANQALHTVLHKHVTAFKAANPRFEPDHIVGCSAGMFFGDAKTGVEGLKHLTQHQTSRKVLGGRTYDVIESPLVDADGQVVAVVCQWMDCTDAWLAEHATERLGNALAQVSKSTLAVQQAIEALGTQAVAEHLPRPTAMLAEKVSGVLAQMVPAIHHTTELMQDPLHPQASEALASTAEQLQSQAALLQAMVASYRLAVGASKARSQTPSAAKQPGDRALVSV